MSERAVRTSRVARHRRRVVARVEGSEHGPTLIGIGGIHGNEPAGIEALRRVGDELGRCNEGVRGQFVALAGNMSALAKGCRYLARDLNRAWLPERIEMLEAGKDTPLYAEGREQAEMLATLAQVFAQSTDRVYLIDLHTTSADGTSFVAAADSPDARSFAATIPLPMIIGLTRHLDGTLLEYVTGLGYTAVAVEGGQHNSSESVDFLEAALWLTLESAGIISEDDWRDIPRMRDEFTRVAPNAPRRLTIRYRHAIVPEDDFRMESGFENFQSVSEGDVVGRDRSGEIRAPCSGLIVLPLYQNLGEDGFFIGSPLNWVCAVRQVGLARALPP